MQKLLLVLAAIAVAYAWRQHAASDFEHPLPLAVERAGDGIRKFDFDRLLDEGTTFEALAAPGFYTVVEGYTDSCSVCRALERDLPSLLDARPDVVVRRVRFKEHGRKQFAGRNAEEIRAAIRTYAEQLKRYRSFHVDSAGDELRIGTCGTPHVEIYGPDGTLLSTDSCDGTVYKDGLAFLRDWISAEQAL